MKFFKILDKIFGTSTYHFFEEIKADQRFRSGDYKGSIKIYEELLKEIPEKSEKYIFRLVQCYRFSGDNEKALFYINIKKDNTDIRLELEKARLYIEMHKDNGLSLMEDYIKNYPDPSLYKEIAYYFMNYGRYEKALLYFEKYRKEKDESVVILEISKIYYYLRDFSKSDEFLEIYRSYPNIDINEYNRYRGLIFESMEKYDKAIHHFKKVLKDDIKDEVCYEHIIILYEAQNRWQEMLDILLEREKEFKSDFELKKKIGKTYLELDQLKRARTYFEILVENNYFEKDFIIDYLKLSIKFKDYLKAENISLKLIDSGVFSREEIAPFLSELYFKTGNIPLMFKYSERESREKYNKMKDRFKNIDVDLEYSIAFFSNEKTEVLKKIEYITVDKINTTDEEILRNYNNTLQASFLLFWNDSNRDIKHNSCINIKEVLKRFPGKFGDPVNVTELEEIVFSIIDFFKKNTKIFKAYLYLANEYEKDFYFFIKRFINMNISNFDVEEFIEDIKAKSMEDGKEDFEDGNFEKIDIFNSENIFISEHSQKGFDKYLDHINKNVNGKFLILASNRDRYNYFRKFYSRNKNIVFFSGEYLCLYHFVQLYKLKGEELKDLIFWMSATESGDLSETHTSDNNRKFITASERNCLQLECPYYEKCFFQNKKKSIYNNKFVLTEGKNSGFFREKIENIINMMDSETLINEIRNSSISFSDISKICFNIEIYFELNLKNTSEGFRFYRDIKENLIKIRKIMKRIEEDLNLRSRNLSSIYYTIIKDICPDFDTYLKRFLNYLEETKETLYMADRFINPSRFFHVELNYIKNEISAISEELKNIYNSNEFYVEHIDNCIHFLPVKKIDLEKYRKRYIFNRYKNIQDIYPFLKKIYRIDNSIHIEELNETDLAKVPSINSISSCLELYSDIGNEEYVYLLSHIIKFIPEKTDFIFDLYMNKKENREFFKDLIEKGEISESFDNIKNILKIYSFSDKNITVYLEQKEIKKLIDYLDHNKIQYCYLSYRDDFEEYRKKLNAINNKYYNIVLTDSSDLIRYKKTYIVYREGNTPDIDLKDLFKIKINEKKDENIKLPAIDIMNKHIGNILSKNKNTVYSNELNYLFFSKQEPEIIIETLKKNYNVKKVHSAVIDFYNKNDDLMEFLCENFYVTKVNKRLILHRPNNSEILCDELMRDLYRSNIKIKNNINIKLNKEISSSEQIIYENLLNIIEGLEFFNSYNEIRVFGKTSFSFEEIKTEHSFFYWLFWLQFNNLLNIELDMENNRFNIEFLKKIESVIIFVKEEFENLSFFLKILISAYNIDTNSNTEINILELFAEIEDINDDMLKQYLYILNYLNIIDSDFITSFFETGYIFEEKK